MSEENEMIDVMLVQKTIDVPMSDEALQEIGDEMSEKILRKVDLEEQIASYTGHRRKEIKTILEDLEPLAEKFHDKTEPRSVECNEVRNFSTGKVWYEDLEGKRIEDIPDRDMDPDGFQREFAILLDNEPGEELLEKAKDEIETLLDDQDESNPKDSEELAQCVAEMCEVSESVSARIVHLLRVKGVIRGRGIPAIPFVIADEEETEEEQEKAQSEELTEDMILEAVKAVNELGRASTSSLQRKTGWGYNRASRIVAILEDRNVISTMAEGAVPEVLMTVEEYEEALFESTAKEEDQGEVDPESV